VHMLRDSNRGIFPPSRYSDIPLLWDIPLPRDIPLPQDFPSYMQVSAQTKTLDRRVCAAGLKSRDFPFPWDIPLPQDFPRAMKSPRQKFGTFRRSTHQQYGTWASAKERDARQHLSLSRRQRCRRAYFSSLSSLNLRIQYFLYA